MIALKKRFYIEDEGESVKIVAEEFATSKAVLQDLTSFGEFSGWHKFDRRNVLTLLSMFRQPESNIFITPLYQKSLYTILKQKTI